MSALSEGLEDYLALRRALGYKLEEHGRVLPHFIEFLEQREAVLITTELALKFATQPAQASVVWWHQRLAIVRGFATHMQAIDPRHEVPPVGLLPAKFRRAIPYLYSPVEIDALMAAARSLRPPLRAASCEALIGLLSVTGMRVSEACSLDRADIEPAERRLTVRQGKNGRSREIPLHASTVDALDRYARVRDELCPHPNEPCALLLTSQGNRLNRHIAFNWFDQVRRAAGLDHKTLGRRARLHDVRHSMVLRTLLGWYREDADVEAQLPLLSTLLGHVHPKDTFWYIEAAPELLALAAERMERTWEDVSPEPVHRPPMPRGRYPRRARLLPPAQREAQR
jgi:integrase/recombinase XerD